MILLYNFHLGTITCTHMHTHNTHSTFEVQNMSSLFTVPSATLLWMAWPICSSFWYTWSQSIWWNPISIANGVNSRASLLATYISNKDRSWISHKRLLDISFHLPNINVSLCLWLVLYVWWWMLDNFPEHSWSVVKWTPGNPSTWGNQWLTVGIRDLKTTCRFIDFLEEPKEFSIML